ncbi:MAG: class 1 fructose-bisphosphatase [Candidatus Rokubacteria bacterium]|nr:class 1 fructose-bisphosphatase [Candidatus Rokubacteria bacterium]MBI3826193.1 class 1 fructose-bisphosphatase [Candidatus Rokubacteria bacterium]
MAVARAVSDGAATLFDHVRAAGDLGILLTQIAVAGKTIARELGRAVLIGQLGTTGETNVQGEKVKKLDLWANEVLVDALTDSGRVCTLVSEELAEPVHLEHRCADGSWVVCFDPVDGSSNLDVNGIVGTIFSIRRRSREARHAMVDAVAPGTVQVAAGYVMYGPATVLVLTLGDGVDAFTLDQTIGEFLRSHARIRIPARGRIYSVNEGNATKWDPAVRRYIDYLRASDGATDRPYSARYVGSLVADFHRTLLEGGIFLYPADTTAGGKPSGKLRLQYEGAPMAFVVEQAGGRASTGRDRIMDVRPSAAHQRVPLVIGSPEDVALAEDFMAGRR